MASLAAMRARAWALPGWNEKAMVFAVRHALGGPEPAWFGRAAPAAPARKAATAAAPAEAEAEEDPALFRRLLARIESSGAPFRRLSHGPTRTSAESAEVRGVALASGAKAMLLVRGLKGAKAAAAEAAGEPTHFLVVLSAERKLDIKAARKLLGKTAKFAAAAEVTRVTGAVVGAVPPFGSAFEGGRVQTVVDRSLLRQGPNINFNCGLRTESVCDLPVDAYLTMEAGHRLEDVSCP